jgi:hypothetical protein
LNEIFAHVFSASVSTTVAPFHRIRIRIDDDGLAHIHKSTGILFSPRRPFDKQDQFA